VGLLALRLSRFTENSRSGRDWDTKCWRHPTICKHKLIRLSDKTASAENWSSRGKNWDDMGETISEWLEVTPNLSAISSMKAVWEVVRALRGLSSMHDSAVYIDNFTVLKC